MKNAISVSIVILALITGMNGALEAQCYGSLALSSSFAEFDYLVRLAVHFGDAASIPSGIMCSRSMLPGELVIDIPVWAYNLHEGAAYLEFSVASNESIAVFVPDNCWSVVGSSRYGYGSEYRLDLALQACESSCGPVRIGYVQMVRTKGSDPVWIDLRPNSQTSKMIAIDGYGRSHNVFSPRHGGFLGQNYLYTCQEPICEEPNASVTELVAQQGPGCSVKVTWVGGSGNRTMIRYRTDRYPTGAGDGFLAVEMPSAPGESQYYFHTGIPSAATLYYKAFSLTRDAGGLITRSSFVECASVDTVKVKCEIGAESTSWGSIKSLFK